MNIQDTFDLHPVGIVQSSLKDKALAPLQGKEGAPDAWIEIDGRFTEALSGLHTGDKIILITWLHEAQRDVLQVHPRSEAQNPLTGVFATRSPDRPNPLGLHDVTILEIVGNRLKVGPLEAVDGTPVVDIKPVR